MNFELIDILINGAVLTKSLLLLLATPEIILEDNNAKKNIDLIFAKHPKYKDDSQIKAIVEFIYTDNFNQETYLDQNNISYLYELKILKDTFIGYLFKSLGELKDTHAIAGDVYSKIGQYALQLLRLRKVIEPDFNISLNPNKVTGIVYLVAKGFWLDDEGQKKRMFTKSIGRLDEMDGGRTGEAAKQAAKTGIQEVIFQKYKEIYI